MPHATSIEGVLQSLDDIIDTSIRENSRIGYFAALYRRVTAEVKGRIEKGRFHDSDRMEHLDVVFANRYLAAYNNFRRGWPTTRSWAIAFRKADDPDLIVLQHLLLGMNAHINLDLGISAAEIAEYESTVGFEDDFNQINDVLFDLVDEIQETLGVTSTFLRVADKLGGRLDEHLCGHALAWARGNAWEKAQRILRSPRLLAKLTDEFDRETEGHATRIHSPTGFLRQIIGMLKEEEDERVGTLVSMMRR